MIGSRRAETRCGDTPRKSAGGVALVDGSVEPVDVGGAAVDADDASGGGHERCGSRTADVARNCDSAGAVASEGARIEVDPV